MLKSIVRTGMAFGALYAAGFVARKYFGMNTDGLMDKAKSTAKDFSKDIARDAKDLKAPLKDVADRHAI